MNRLDLHGAVAATATTGVAAPASNDAPATKPVTTHTVQSLPASPPQYGRPVDGAGAIGGALVALLLVVGLILALAWLAKRMPGVARKPNSALRVIASLPLTTRERVVVIAVGETQLLLGVGPGGTRTLHTLTEPLPVTEPAPSPFAHLLSQRFGNSS